MGFLDHLPTLAEARTARCASAKGAEPSRLQKKVADAKDERKEEAAWKKALDRRDRHECRWCHRRVVATLERIPERAEHHHVSGRVVRSIRWDRRNGILLCCACHERVTGKVAEKHLIESTHTFVSEGIAYINADKPCRFVRIA